MKSFSRELFWIRHVDGTPFEVTPVTVPYITPPHHGHTRSMSWSWMTDSHLFCSMSICPPIPEMRLFQIWTWNLKAKVMGVVIQLAQYLIDLHSFHSNSAISKVDLEKSKVKVMGEIKRSRSNSWPGIQLMHFLFVSCQSDQTFLRYGQ